MRRAASRLRKIAPPTGPGAASGWVVNVLFRLLYWLAVLAVSLALLVGLILLIESRDSSSVGNGRAPAGARV